jgi:hypothetical protein
MSGANPLQITRNQEYTKMAKATKATEGTAPKKRTTKANPEAGNGTEVVKTAKPVPAQPSKSASAIEEKIRARAYELFLERKGHGGSPEQDWLQAVAEIHEGSVA